GSQQKKEENMEEIQVATSNLSEDPYKQQQQEMLFKEMDDEESWLTAGHRNIMACPRSKPRPKMSVNPETKMEENILKWILTSMLPQDPTTIQRSFT
ncbi:13246_t:CDS:1, partial [Acaulospora colombiana]